MRVHFENVNPAAQSGPNSFARRLSKALYNLGHSIVGSYQESDITCVFIECQSHIPDEHPKVQRLDGIWFKPDEFIEKNQGIKLDFERSHRIIWQSKFDRQMTARHWGDKPGDIIHNGIEIQKRSVTHNSITSLREKYDLLFVASANWHPQKRLSKNIALFSLARQKVNRRCGLIIMGNRPDYLAKDSDIYYTGLIPHETCLEIFAASDWMIHLAWLDHCPNTVVESLSQECPVICTDSGGTAEIVRDNGIVIPETTPYNFELTDYDNPYDLNLDEFPFDVITNRINVVNEHIDIRKTAKEYEQTFLRVLEGEVK